MRLLSARTAARRLGVLATIALAALAGPAARTVADAAAPRAQAVAWSAEAQRADRTAACIYTRNDLELLAAFQRRIGRAFSCAVVFNDAAPGWAGWVEPWVQVHPDPRFQWDEWVRAEPGRRLVLTQSLVPADAPPDWRPRGARGLYDRHARTLARNLVRAGLGDSVIRLSHEMNGTWYRDNIGSTPAQFRDWRRYWARIVRIMRAQPGAHFTFDWNIAAGYRAIPLGAYYPGDDVVDVVGIDYYDYRFSADVPLRPGAARWRAQASQSRTSGRPAGGHAGMSTLLGVMRCPPRSGRAWPAGSRVAATGAGRGRTTGAEPWRSGPAGHRCVPGRRPR